MLPPGETNAEKLFVAVGMAIHAWEAMEEAFARLFALFTALPENPYALSEYGADNRVLVHRLEAVKEAGNRYFVKCPNQSREGEFTALCQEAAGLAIKRHRIAHGHITMWAHIQLPDAPGPFEVESKILFRWGAPFYSIDNLRTDPVGGDAASIDAARTEFEALHNRVAAFTALLRI